MSETHLALARRLFAEYGEFCDSVIETIELNFGSQHRNAKLVLICRHRSLGYRRIWLILSNLTEFRLQFGEKEEAGALSEGIRLGSAENLLFIDFGSDPDLLPGETGWQTSSTRWCICVDLKIVDKGVY
jgi:hypothetical protein